MNDGAKLQRIDDFRLSLCFMHYYNCRISPHFIAFLLGDMRKDKKRARYESLTPRSFQRMLVFISVTTLKIVVTATSTNKLVVCKSNNIIFTLNLLTTNLMNNVCSRHDYNAKVILCCQLDTNCANCMRKHHVFLT